MEIEIITTKKKLTKSLVNQMRTAGMKELDAHDVHVLGYLIGVVKGMRKAVLLKSGADYFVISPNWEKGETSWYKSVVVRGKKWSSSWKFENEERSDEAWRRYRTLMAKADTQIYL